MKPRRVILGFDAAAPLNRAALEAAALLAQRMEAELVGLFIENVDLLHLAALPFTREIDLLSATSRDLDTERMERALRALARDAQRMLASVAGRGTLRWSFRVTRGALAAELLAAAGEADLLVTCVVRSRGAAEAPPIRLLSARSLEALRAALEDQRGGILVLTSDGDEAAGIALREWSGQSPDEQVTRQAKKA